MPATLEPFLGPLGALALALTGLLTLGRLYLKSINQRFADKDQTIALLRDAVESYRIITTGQLNNISRSLDLIEATGALRKRDRDATV